MSSSSANVRSLERLEGFLDHTLQTRAHLLKELENLQVEMQRLTRWLENEADRYWASELQAAQRQWVEAEQALLRCRSVVRESDRRPCTEQKKRLEAATERRSFCEQQVRFLRDAKLMWQHQAAKLDTKIFRCRDMTETELTLAINRLKEQLERLDEYSRLRSGAVSGPEPVPTEAINNSLDQPTPAPPNEPNSVSDNQAE